MMMQRSRSSPGFRRLNRLVLVAAVLLGVAGIATGTLRRTTAAKEPGMLLAQSPVRASAQPRPVEQHVRQHDDQRSDQRVLQSQTGSVNGGAFSTYLGWNTGDAYDYFGTSVAVDTSNANLIAVGQAFADPSNLTNAGLVAVFLRNELSGDWTCTDILTASDRAAYTYFGYSISLSNGVLVAGSPGDDYLSYFDAGSIYIFDCDPLGSCTQLDNFGDDTPGHNAEFGTVVAISGNVLVVGAPYDSYTGGSGSTAAGSFHVYYSPTNSASNFVKIDEVFWGSDPPEFGYYGWGAAFDVTNNRRVAVTAPGLQSGRGKVRLIEIDTASNSFHTTEVLSPSNDTASSYSFFGYSVAFDGSIAAVGAPYADDTDEGLVDSGVVFVFAFVDESWAEAAILSRSDASDDSLFGTVLAASNGVLVVGNPFDTVQEQDDGSIDVYVRSTVDSTVVVPTDPSARTFLANGEVDAFFGYAVAIANSTLVVGVPGHTVDGTVSHGSALVLNLSCHDHISCACTQANGSFSTGYLSVEPYDFCTLCPPGYVSDLIGSVGDTNENTVCDPVQRGTYADAWGSFDGTNCPVGTALNATGSTSASDCQKCVKNTYSGAGAAKCTPCDDGQYSLAGSGNCTEHNFAASMVAGVFALVCGAAMAFLYLCTARIRETVYEERHIKTEGDRNKKGSASNKPWILGPTESGSTIERRGEEGKEAAVPSGLARLLTARRGLSSKSYIRRRQAATAAEVRRKHPVHPRERFKNMMKTVFAAELQISKALNVASMAKELRSKLSKEHIQGTFAIERCLGWFGVSASARDSVVRFGYLVLGIGLFVVLCALSLLGAVMALLGDVFLLLKSADVDNGVRKIRTIASNMAAVFKPLKLDWTFDWLSDILEQLYNVNFSFISLNAVDVTCNGASGAAILIVNVAAVLLIAYALEFNLFELSRTTLNRVMMRLAKLRAQRGGRANAVLFVFYSFLSMWVQAGAKFFIQTMAGFVHVSWQSGNELCDDRTYGFDTVLAVVTKGIILVLAAPFIQTLLTTAVPGIPPDPEHFRRVVPWDHTLRPEFLDTLNSPSVFRFFFKFVQHQCYGVLKGMKLATEEIEQHQLENVANRQSRSMRQCAQLLTAAVRGLEDIEERLRLHKRCKSRYADDFKDDNTVYAMSMAGDLDRLPVDVGAEYVWWIELADGTGDIEGPFDSGHMRRLWGVHYIEPETRLRVSFWPDGAFVSAHDLHYETDDEQLLFIRLPLMWFIIPSSDRASTDVHGPFSARQMRARLDLGQLTESMLVRTVFWPRFLTVEALLYAVGPDNIFNRLPLLPLLRALNKLYENERSERDREDRRTSSRLVPCRMPSNSVYSRSSSSAGVELGDVSRFLMDERMIGRKVMRPSVYELQGLEMAHLSHSIGAEEGTLAGASSPQTLESGSPFASFAAPESSSETGGGATPPPQIVRLSDAEHPTKRVIPYRVNGQFVWCEIPSFFELMWSAGRERSWSHTGHLIYSWCVAIAHKTMNFLCLTVGIWTDDLVRSMRIEYQTRIFAGTDKEELADVHAQQSFRMEIVSLTAAGHCLMWQLIPYCVVISKYGDRVNRSPLAIFTQYATATDKMDFGELWLDPVTVISHDLTQVPKDAHHVFWIAHWVFHFLRGINTWMKRSRLVVWALAVLDFILLLGATVIPGDTAILTTFVMAAILQTVPETAERFNVVLSQFAIPAPALGTNSKEDANHGNDGGGEGESLGGGGAGDSADVAVTDREQFDFARFDSGIAENVEDMAADMFEEVNEVGDEEDEGLEDVQKNADTAAETAGPKFEAPLWYNTFLAVLIGTVCLTAACSIAVGSLAVICGEDMKVTSSETIEDTVNATDVFGVPGANETVQEAPATTVNSTTTVRQWNYCRNSGSVQTALVLQAATIVSAVIAVALSFSAYQSRSALTMRRLMYACIGVGVFGGVASFLLIDVGFAISNNHDLDLGSRPQWRAFLSGAGIWAVSTVWFVCLTRTCLHIHRFTFYGVTGSFSISVRALSTRVDEEASTSQLPQLTQRREDEGLFSPRNILSEQGRVRACSNMGSFTNIFTFGQLAVGALYVTACATAAAESHSISGNQSDDDQGNQSRGGKDIRRVLPVVVVATVCFWLGCCEMLFVRRHDVPSTSVLRGVRAVENLSLRVVLSIAAMWERVLQSECVTTWRWVLEQRSAEGFAWLASFRVLFSRRYGFLLFPLLPAIWVGAATWRVLHYVTARLIEDWRQGQLLGFARVVCLMLLSAAINLGVFLYLQWRFTDCNNYWTKHCTGAALDKKPQVQATLLSGILLSTAFLISRKAEAKPVRMQAPDSGQAMPFGL